MKGNNKVVIITGSGGKGSGRAMALKFAKEGSHVIVSDINEKGGHETVRIIKEKNGKAIFFGADISREKDVQNLISIVVDTYGRLDVLVNNAQNFIPDLLNGWFEQVQTNIIGTMYCIKYAVDSMKETGGGAIVNMSSVSALKYTQSNSPAYDASNAAILRLTAGLIRLKELHNIRVNTLASDWIGTEEILAYIATLTPEQRTQRQVPEMLNTPESIADAVYQLAMDQTLFSRIMVCWCGQPKKFIPFESFGYSHLE